MKRRIGRVAAQARRGEGAGPLAAIALPTCEPPIALLEALVSSLRAQDHESWICVIGDDHSPADFLGAIRSLIEDDQRFVLSAATERLGASRNIERILEAIGDSVDLVALADQTDRWHPGKLTRLVAALGPRTRLVSGDVRILGPDRSPLCEGVRAACGDPPVTIESLISAHLVPGSGALLRRELLDVALPFPDHLGLRHDQWLAIAAQATGEIELVDEALTDHVATEPERALAMIEANARAARDQRRRWTRGRRSRREIEARRREIQAVLDRRLSAATRPEVSPIPAPQPGSRASAPPLQAPARSSNGAAPDRELAISVRNVSKVFAIPAPPPETLGGRLRHPLRRLQGEGLTALQDVSFDVARGEFFGIAGNNGSGKSTLLQVLANIYKPDTGRVLIAPRVAPIISMGVGFNQELDARPNVLAVAELLGVPPEQARASFEQVLAFANLEDFAHLKLRQYSTGMRVRLAFATTLLVDADVLLLDEVMAVGDEVFRERAKEAFQNLLSDKTVVLVTHNMHHIQSLCERALLLHHGRVELIGDPAEVARRYTELALEMHGEKTDILPGAPAPAERRAEIVDLRLADSEGVPTVTVGPGEDILLHATVVASAPILNPGFRFEILRRGVTRMFAPPTLSLGEGGRRVRAGDRLEVETTIENKLAPGTYTLACVVTGEEDGPERSVSAARTTDFGVAAGPSQVRGIMDLAHTVRVRQPVDGDGSNDGPGVNR